MKKIIVLLFVFCFLFSACSINNGNNGGTPTSNSEPSTSTTVTPGASSSSTATGTQAALYDENLSYLEQNIGSYFSEKGESEKITFYDTPVTVTSVNWYTPALESSMVKFGEKYGETFDNNRWTDAYKRVFNVDVEYKWWASGADYNQKLRLDMTANDLPDIFIVQEQNDLVQLAQSGAIWDLSDMMETWASKENIDMWESDGGALFEMATVDGKLYGLPNALSDTDFFSYLWIRSDWMDQLNLEYPKTMDELAHIIEAFAKADLDGNGTNDTIGLFADKDLYYPLRGLFSAFNAYPEIWVETDKGLEWGATTQTNKNALAYLADLYSKGYMDPEFITKSNADALKSVISGNCGVVYGGHWLGHNMGDLHELDENSDWRCIVLPTGTGEAVKSPLKPTSHGWTVVNSQFDHPEIAFMMRNLQSYTKFSKDSTWWAYDENNSWIMSPIHGNASAYDNLFTYMNLQEAYQNNNDTSLLKGKAVPYWDNLHGSLSWEWEMMFGPDDKTPMTVLKEAYENDKLFYDAFLGCQSNYMQERWSTIKDEQLLAFTKIIIGEVGVDEGFEQWLNTFNNMGGDKITAEVNEWYKTTK